METTIKLKIVLEVPESDKDKVEEFKDTLTEMIRGKAFSLFAVRNVIRLVD